ncbi:MAG: type 4a pilus biogenesis protein PilO [Candidatus Rokubacteria bacterium]|nr:type 4a pilus biogenesis protein PilO [Candidatus Rokubacteria bacterium]MBI2543710.1 type 4a pilus biogenesis protein PilO [Candidatus Rokubacteria bacterium]
MAFEIITQAPRSQKIIFGVIVLAVLLAGGYFLLLSPKWAEVNALRQQRAAKEVELIQSRALAGSLARFKQEAQALRARLEAAKERLPSEKEIPGLYRQVSDMAYQTGLAVSLFQPKEPATKEIYQEVPISLSAEAGYHQLGTFLERIARLPRIVNLTDLKITGISRPTGTIKADLTLATYVFRPEGAPPPPARPGARPPTPPQPGAPR